MAAVGAALSGAALAMLSTTPSSAGETPWAGFSAPHDGLGIEPGKIKHVWLIILENKSYDASFTGLNNNTYLWQTLPSQGALLQNYYGTGHFSLDNYVSMVSGQATQPDTQSDCPDYTSFLGSLDTSGNLFDNLDFGQFVSAAGPNAEAGTNGCVYPASVPTLFNQLDAAHVSWKGYAQDLGNLDSGATTSHAVGGPTQPWLDCGAPFAAPSSSPTVSGGTPNTAQPNPGSANVTDQYVPKHFPFPWFESILASGDCNSAHIANLFDASNGLYSDLQNESTTPAFSWISPNNCSDAHDAVCKGNNLSGGWVDANTPNPTPLNHTGGLYASDLFLEHVVPEIEASPAFKDGGLIDITFDEAFPAFTYTGNSFANSTLIAPNAAASVASDTAGQNIYGHNVNTEPSGPNTPLVKDSSGNELTPGPGDNAFIDRPSTCEAQTVPSLPSTACVAGGGTIGSPAARTDALASAATNVSTIYDPSIVATDAGRSVAGTGIPPGAFVGTASDEPTTAASATDSAVTGFFPLVDSGGHALDTTAAVSGVTLGARTAATDPLMDATDATNGGGDTGSVLISQYIKPGTVSTTFYNHYSWLRTIEDLFNVASASPGLDREGHIGYAAQPGLAPFGPDVFSNAGTDGHGHDYGPRRH